MVTAHCQSPNARMRSLAAGIVVSIWAISLVCLAGTQAPRIARAQTASESQEVQPGRVLPELWEAVYLDGVKSGHAHHRYQEVTIRGKPYIMASSTMELKVRRFGQPMTLATSMANYETPQGQVASLTFTMQTGRDQRIVRRGVVHNGELLMQVQVGQQPPREVRIPWSADALGLYAEQRFFSQQDWRPGQLRSYVKFVPELNRFMRCQVKAEDYEAGSHTNGRRWLRLQASFEQIGNLKIPDAYLWLNEEGRLVRQETTWPDLGKITLVRASQEQALAPGNSAAVDIGLKQVIRLSRPIPNAQQARRIVYRLQLRSGTFGEGLFPQDDRQRFLKRETSLLELEVRRGIVPGATERAQLDPPVEYLRSNQVVNAEDKLVQELARRAIGGERDPWRRAVFIERWVHANMKKGTYTEGFASADEVARSREGDCTEHAVLAAAMCRAVGVPSRLAMGLAYVEQLRGMVSHMWLEVWINGRWYALDPTLGRGQVPATHIKIAHHSWNDVQPLRPLIVYRTVLPDLSVEAIHWE